MQHANVLVGPCAVGQPEADDGGDQQDDAAGGVGAQELAERGVSPAVSPAVRQAGSSFGARGVSDGQVVVDDLVPRERGPDDGLQDGDSGDGQDRAQRPEQRRPGDDRPERDGRVHVHGVRGHPGGQRHVLDLLVDEDEPEQHERFPRRVQHGDEQGYGCGDVGTHGRDELRDQAHPERQRHGERHP